MQPLPAGSTHEGGLLRGVKAALETSYTMFPAAPFSNVVEFPPGGPTMFI